MQSCWMVQTDAYQFVFDGIIKLIGLIFIQETLFGDQRCPARGLNCRVVSTQPMLHIQATTTANTQPPSATRCPGLCKGLRLAANQTLTHSSELQSCCQGRVVFPLAMRLPRFVRLLLVRTISTRRIVALCSCSHRKRAVSRCQGQTGAAPPFLCETVEQPLLHCSEY